MANRRILKRDDANPVVVIDAADVGETELARGALNESCFESRFKLDELSADGRLRHPQQLGSAANAARLHDAHED